MLAVVDLIGCTLTVLACYTAAFYLTGRDRRERYAALREIRQRRDRVRLAHSSAAHPSIN